jgi:hypothetical protein
MQVHLPVKAAQSFMVDTFPAITQPIVTTPEADRRMFLRQMIQLVLYSCIILWLRKVGTGGAWQLHHDAGLPVATLSPLFKKEDSFSFNGRPYHFFANNALAASS